MNRTIEPLLSAAIRAPSGDNTQPWRFVVDAGAGRIAFFVDETRDPSPMNAGQRMARIAVGATLENLLRTAARSGWDAQLENPSPPAVALVRITGMDRGDGEVEPIVTERVTNRRAYDGRAVAADVLASLERETPPLEGVSAHWLAGRERLAGLAPLIGRADALMFGEPSMRRAFLPKVRFDAAPDAQVEEGLSLASLELSAMDRFSLRLMPRLPDWMLKVMGAMRVFAAKARQLVQSASGLCLVVALDDKPRTDLLVGRAMQRAWLALTGAGLAAQPMMSLPVLENALAHGSPALLASLGREKITALQEEFRSLVPEVGSGRPAFLMRFGYAPAPSGRTGRLAVSAVATEGSSVGRAQLRGQEAAGFHG